MWPKNPRYALAVFRSRAAITAFAAVAIVACGGDQAPYDEHIVTEVNAAVVAIVDAEIGPAEEHTSKIDGQLCRGYDGTADDVAERIWSRWDLGEDFDLGLSLLDHIESHLAGRDDIDTLERWDVTANSYGLSAVGDGYKVGASVAKSVTGQVTFGAGANGACH